MHLLIKTQISGDPEAPGCARVELTDELMAELRRRVKTVVTLDQSMDEVRCAIFHVSVDVAAHNFEDDQSWDKHFKSPFVVFERDEDAPELAESHEMDFPYVAITPRGSFFFETQDDLGQVFFTEEVHFETLEKLVNAQSK